MSLKDEIAEQPTVLQRLLTEQWPHVQEIAASLKEHSFNYVFLAARGTSDHAGLYAKYLWGAVNELPVALATPSLFSRYGTPPHLTGALVLGISQSGQSTDIVSVIAVGHQQGQPTLAITNNPGSPLADAAKWVIDIAAGPEQAVAATKTYTAQLMAVALLSVALADKQDRYEALLQTPEWVKQVLGYDEMIQRIAERYRYMDQCVVIGRGYNYATAFEWSLKLKELAYVVSEPYSSADFQHGPIAVVSQGFPVFAVVPDGAVFDDQLKLLKRLKRDYRVELLVISDRQEALDLADTPIPLPTGIPEWITPLVDIVPAQLFCYHLTRAKGFDTESPRGLRIVTITH